VLIRICIGQASRGRQKRHDNPLPFLADSIFLRSDSRRPHKELLAFRNRDRRDANEAVQRMMRVAQAGPADAEYRLVAGNGEWLVLMKERGTITAMHPITLDELQGLPDDYEPPA
jgi:hypothetical protein